VHQSGVDVVLAGTVLTTAAVAGVSVAVGVTCCALGALTLLSAQSCQRRRQLKRPSPPTALRGKALAGSSGTSNASNPLSVASSNCSSAASLAPLPRAALARRDFAPEAATRDSEEAPPYTLD